MDEDPPLYEEDERCTCDHDSDDMCLNGIVYVNCGSEACGGACDDQGDLCQGGPGCCDKR